MLCRVPIKRCTVHCVLCAVCTHQSQQQGDNSPCLSVHRPLVCTQVILQRWACNYVHAFQFTETLRQSFTNNILEKLILSFPCCPRSCMITPSHYNGGATPLTAPLELLNATNYHLFGQPSPTTPYRCPSQFKLDSISLNFCQF